MDTKIKTDNKNLSVPDESLADFERNALLERIQSTALMALNQRLTNGSLVPHSAELLESVMKLCGGVDGFAGLLMAQHWHSKPGSPGRGKILESVVRLVAQNSALGGAKKPTHLMDDVELMDALENRMRVHNKGQEFPKITHVG